MSATAGRGLGLLRTIALACHATLVVTLALTALSEGPTLARIFAASAIVLPLLATASGLARGRREPQQWLAVLLVLYVGATSIEVVARAGAPLLSAALLASDE